MITVRGFGPGGRKRRQRRSRRAKPKLPLEGFSAAELGAKVGVSARTIRYYTAQHVLPAAVFRGSATRYLHEHLVQVAAIRVLQRDHRWPLPAIRGHLDALPLADVERLASAILPELAPAAIEVAAPAPPAVSDVWHRFTVVPGLEIHCYSGTSTEVKALARSLQQHALGRSLSGYDLPEIDREAGLGQGANGEQ